MWWKNSELARTAGVVEIASNDGYLLQYFAEKEIPVLGIEPAQNVAAVARAKGIPTRVDFLANAPLGRCGERGCAQIS